MRSQDEFRLSCVVSDFLAKALPPRARYTHFPAGEHRSRITGARLKRMGMQRGWPDYLVICDGKLIGLELKAPGGSSISPEQRAVGDAFVDNGFAWTLAKSCEDVERFLLEQGVPLRATQMVAA